MSSTSTPPMSLDATSQPRGINDKPSAESHFFGAVKGKIRSRSRRRSSQNDAQSNPVLPPTSMPKDDSQSPPRPRVQRMSSTLSRETTASSTSTAYMYKRRSTTSSFYSGRHSNEWLFGGFSVTDTVKDAYHYFREKRE